MPFFRADFEGIGRGKQKTAVKRWCFGYDYYWMEVAIAIGRNDGRLLASNFTPSGFSLLVLFRVTIITSLRDLH